MSEKRRLVIIGDALVGKTHLLKVFEKGEYVEMPHSTVLDNFEKRIKHPMSAGDELVLHL